MTGGIIGISDPFITRPELSGTSMGHAIGAWLGQPMILGALALVAALSILLATFDASKRVFWGFFAANIGSSSSAKNTDDSDDDDVGESPAAWLMRSGQNSMQSFIGKGGLAKGKPTSAKIGNAKGIGSNDDTNDHRQGTDWSE
jgi:hypothetical protein